MIRIPVCCFCKYYSSRRCPAYPNGISDDMLLQKKRDDSDCGNGVKFTKING